MNLFERTGEIHSAGGDVRGKMAEKQRMHEYLMVNLAYDTLGMLLCLNIGIQLGELCALMNAKFLSAILGHSNVNITMNRYVHATMEMQRENPSSKTRIMPRHPKRKLPASNEKPGVSSCRARSREKRAI